MQKWEYKEVTMYLRRGFSLVEQLNKLGKDGWEVASRLDPTMGHSLRFLLKRLITV